MTRCRLGTHGRVRLVQVVKTRDLERAGRPDADVGHSIVVVLRLTMSALEISDLVLRANP